MNEYEINRLVTAIYESIDGEDVDDLLHDVVRVIYEGKDKNRLRWSFREFGHAWTNAWVEPAKRKYGKKYGYVLGHVVSMLFGVMVLAVVGSLSAMVLIVIGSVLGG